MQNFQNFIFNLLVKKPVCQHTSALVDIDDGMEGYCPDCGAYLKKYFYIVRCAHCEIKRDALQRFEQITPTAKFCENCGGHEFYVEKLEKISFIDIKYAIHTKEIVELPEPARFSQLWVEKCVAQGETTPTLVCPPLLKSVF